MVIELAPNLELAKIISADISIEAEYGDEVVEGAVYTAAHHGSRSSNLPPCVDWHIPVMPDALVLVSHLDLDTLGGIARAWNDESIAYTSDNADEVELVDAFWRLAAYKDVHGAHKLVESPDYSNQLLEKLNAFHAWNEENRKQYSRYTVTDVTADVEEALLIIFRILHPTRRADVELIEAGRIWQKRLDELDKSSLVSQHGRVLVRVADKFVSTLYHSDADIIVAFNTINKTITLSTAEIIPWFDCAEILQAQLGKDAGGRANIAGSPRGEKMDLLSLVSVLHAVMEKQEGNC